MLIIIFEQVIFEANSPACLIRGLVNYFYWISH